MAYTVETSPAVDRALGRLPRDEQRRLAAAMRALADDPRPHG